MMNLKTWGEKSSFSYCGNIKEGTKISFGNGHVIWINADQYKDLLNYFSGKTVMIGTSRTSPSDGSVGQWLIENVTKSATASYIGAILVHEGYAEKIGKSEIKFNQY